MIKYLAIISFAFVVSMNVCAAGDRKISGRVMDVHGRPMNGVRVEAYRHFPAGGATKVEGATDADGNFSLDRVGRAVAFYKDRFQPTALLLQPNNPNVTVTLNPSAETDWQLSECSQRKERHYGQAVWFFVPASAKVKVHAGEDTADAIVFFPGNKKEKLFIWYGIMMSAFSVPERFIINSSPLSMREIVGRGVVRGTDARGSDKDGKRWRFVGTRDRIEYTGVSNEAARFFDQIIDSACFPPGDGRAKDSSR